MLMFGLACNFLSPRCTERNWASSSLVRPESSIWDQTSKRNMVRPGIRSKVVPRKQLELPNWGFSGVEVVGHL